jgi:hypothetical protein
MQQKWEPREQWVLRIPLIDGGGFGSKDHERIADSLQAILEHMNEAGVDSKGGVQSPANDTVASWRIEKIPPR